jgi:transposase
MWTQENRPRYDRGKLRYPSDLTDEEWSWIEPHIPAAKRGGRRREVDVREVVDGVMYVLSTGCQWRYIPKDLPPRSTVHEYFQRWQYDGTLRKIHRALYIECREQIGREASPTACVIDSQSVKSVEKGGPASIPTGTMPVRKSKAKSAIFWLIPSAFCSTRWCIRRIFRTVTEASWFSRHCSVFIRSFENCSPTRATRVRNSPVGQPPPFLACQLKS